MRNRWMARWAVGAVAICLAGSAQAGTIRELGQVTARAAIIVDNHTGDVIFARNPNVKLPPASTTKVLSALVAVRDGELDRDIRVSRYASRVQPSKIWLQPGWTMGARDLVYAMLLSSANDASIALAEGIAGSVPQFARMMNSTARSLGAMRSRFVNPNGLPANGHYSTVRDLTTILHHALTVPELRQILSTRTTVIRPRKGSRRRITLRSRNRLLGRKDMQVIGKTGYTRRAKRCFVGAAAAGEREVLVAVLGSRNLWKDLDRLIAYGLNQSTPRPVWPRDTRWQVAAAPAPDVPAEGDMGEVAEPRFRYHVRLASFRSRARAERLQQQVAMRGYVAAVEPTRGKQRAMYRVTVRDFTTRASARQAARVLGKAFRIEPLIVAARA